MVLKEVCLDCQTQMRVYQVGAILLELDGNGEPYKLWHADVLECPGCKRLIVSRFADQPASQQGLDGFDQRVDEADILCVF